MMLVTEDGNGEGEVMGCNHFLEGKRGRRRGGSMVPEADDTVKSGVAAREVEGGLASRSRRRPKEIGSVDRMGSWDELLTKPMKKIWLRV
jgi:hypothetical protein